MAIVGVCLLWVAPLYAADRPAPRFTAEIQPLLKRHCVKCHGPAKQEAQLNLSTASGVIRGGMNGAVLVPHDVGNSLLWKRVADDEMPPESPLSEDEKALLKNWIAAGAPGLPSRDKVAGAVAGKDHWAFQPLQAVAVPAVRDKSRLANEIDDFLQSELERQGLSLAPAADRATLIRRVSFDLTGLPPTVAEIETFVNDPAPNAYSRMVDRYLASPHYGERWGKYWLDAAGYADSNGYFNADSDRPLAYRYRDWVVRALNSDKPFDQFVRGQIAGDEMAGFTPGNSASAEVIGLLEATHYLRNSQDGTGESDGNPDEVRVDRYTVIEGTIQNMMNSLLGLTIQCAKCHDHKFEPITQRDYYQLQAVLAPVYNLQNWVKPQERFVYASLPGEFEAWDSQVKTLDAAITREKQRLYDWARQHRPHGTVVLADDFDAADLRLDERWSNTAPGDNTPAGSPPANIGSSQAPGVYVAGGVLKVQAADGQSEGWVSTKQKIDWTPAEIGGVIQVTFDLTAVRLNDADPPAERVGYYLALHDFQNDSPVAGGNLLIDGNPKAATTVYLDYPGGGSKSAGEVGGTGYQAGRNYGIRITHVKQGRYQLEHLVDFLPDGKSLTLAEADLPDGGFGIAVYAKRNFAVDNLVIERFEGQSESGTALTQFRKNYDVEKQALDGVQKQRAALSDRPGKIAWASDLSDTAPDVFVLERGDYAKPAAKVEPEGLAVLSDAGHPFQIRPVGETRKTTGRRLAFAHWITAPDSTAAALLARVQVNRVWHRHFGTGIVAPVDNLGISGALPSHPELLEWLAWNFAARSASAETGTVPWSLKQLHRVILNSAAYRQSSRTDEVAFQKDPDNRLLWRYPVRRLDAEAIRDALLAVSGDLNPQVGGPFAATKRLDTGEVVPADPNGSGRRRSLYLQQRRTQVTSLLAVFDAPTIVFNSPQRPVSTMPLQTLALLNSEFVVERARNFARRLESAADADPARVRLAWLSAWNREPESHELTAALEFLEGQAAEHATDNSPRESAWADLCQMLLAANEFLYVE
ncbi:MAG: PSD1 domain-containing protein [Planctomycetes bacterium]|nr:PSD1 domain-containing protein [Planctomycetota bacterium]